MTSAEFAAWIVRSLVLAFAAVLAHRASPAGRGLRATLPLLAFAALLVLTAHDHFHGPQLALTVPGILAPPTALAVWSTGSDFSGVPSNVLVAIWLAGVAFLLIRDVVGVWRLRAFIRASRPLIDPDWLDTLHRCRTELGLTAPVELRLSSHLGPAATGLRRSIVLLPPDCLGWTSDQCRFVLLHELAHFLHGDLQARILARVVCAIQWFNPFVWLLARRMDLDRETACDAVVAATTAAPAAYAETLLDFAESSSSVPLLLAPAFGASSRNTLEARILRLLAPAVRHSIWRHRCCTFLALASLALAVFLCACTWHRAVPLEGDIRLRLTADPFPGEPH